jgi:hypothetical protein
MIKNHVNQLKIATLLLVFLAITCGSVTVFAQEYELLKTTPYNYASGSGTLVAGGMTQEQAEALVAYYRDTWSNGMDGVSIYDAGCVGGYKANCVAFSEYFVKRYTTLTWASCNGGCVVDSMKRANPNAGSGTEPHPYAIFSTSSTGIWAAYGHTGVVLGIDDSNNTIIIGEAGCGSTNSWTGAHAYPLSRFRSGYNYIYTEGHLRSIDDNN